MLLFGEYSVIIIALNSCAKYPWKRSTHLSSACSTHLSSAVAPSSCGLRRMSSWRSPSHGCDCVHASACVHANEFACAHMRHLARRGGGDVLAGHAPPAGTVSLSPQASRVKLPTRWRRCAMRNFLGAQWSAFATRRGVDHGLTITWPNGAVKGLGAPCDAHHDLCRLQRGSRSKFASSAQATNFKSS